MEINKRLLDNKILMVIKDDKSTFSVENSVDINKFLTDKVDNARIISINDIREIYFHDFSVYDVINKFMLRYNKKGKKFIKEILKLSTLSLDYLKKDPFYLNDGEKFKLILSLVLMLNPNTIIINNMSCFLDNKSRDEIMFTLKKLKREYKKNIVLVDNDVDYFYTVSNDVMVIVNDEVILYDKKEKIYDNYNMLKRRKVSIPIYIEFIEYAKRHHDNDMLVRDDVKDIMKDIYRSL